MSKKTILFIEPPVDYPIPINFTGVNLGLLSLASYIRQQHGSDVVLYYQSAQMLRTLGEDLSIQRILDELRPDVVCITSITASSYYATQIAGRAKEFGSLVIFGGIYASLNATEIMNECSDIDIVVHGEGEGALSDLISTLENRHDWHNVPGITFRSGHRVITTQKRSLLDISRLPSPAWDVLPINVCRKLELSATLETARGCPFECVFCTLTDPRMWTRTLREKEPSQIISELRGAKSIGFDKIEIADPTFGINRQRTLFLCKEMRKAHLGLRLRVETRIDILDHEMLEAMIAAGVDSIIIGVEAIEPRSLTAMRKTKNAVEWKLRTLNVLEQIAKKGITVHPVFMLGWPGQRDDDLRILTEFCTQTLGFGNGVKPFVAFATPHPGSVLWRTRNRIGLKLVTSDLKKYIHLYPVAIPESLGPNALQLLIKTHNTIRVDSRMTGRNPCISLDFVKSYADLTAA